MHKSWFAPLYATLALGLSGCNGGGDGSAAGGQKLPAQASRRLTIILSKAIR